MFGVKTSQDAEQILMSVQDQLKMVATEAPHRVTDAANEVERWRGVTTTLIEWEQDLKDLLAHAEEQGWSDDKLTIGKYRILTRMLVRRADDGWSGRGNDGKRSYHDGRMEALDTIADDLRFAAEVNV